MKDLFESIPDYRKIGSIIISIQNDKDLLTECGFLKSDFNRFCLEFKRILIDQNEEYLDHIKNQEEAFIVQFLDKRWNNILL